MRVNVRCPACGKTGGIEIPKDAITENSRGISVIIIPEKTICADSFIAYIDNNLIVRDTILTDFQVELPELIIEKRVEGDISYSEDSFDLDLIKLNLTPTLLSYILRGFFFKKKIVLISDKHYLNNHISNFFKYITQNSFETDLTIRKREDYNRDKKNYKKYLVFEGKEIITDKAKIIDTKITPIERKIIQQFFAEYEKEISLMILKNEIQKAFQLSKFISEFIIKSEEKKRIDITEITDNLQKVYKTKVTSIYLDFLLGIVEHYFDVAVPSSQKLVLKLAH